MSGAVVGAVTLLSGAVPLRIGFSIGLTKAPKMRRTKGTKVPRMQRRLIAVFSFKFVIAIW